MVIQENISRRKSDALDIDLADLQEVREEEFVTVNCERTNSCSRYQFCAEEEGFGSFYDNLLSNSRRYVSLFAEAADELMPRRASDLMDEDDTFDILLQQVKTLGSLSSRHISKHLLHREKMLRQILMMCMVLIKDCPTYCGAVSEYI